jgi:hypothetical protein
MIYFNCKRPDDPLRQLSARCGECVLLCYWSHLIPSDSRTSNITVEYRSAELQFFCLSFFVLSILPVLLGRFILVVVLQGLAEHKDTLGAPLCPCRFVTEGFMSVISPFPTNIFFFANLSLDLSSWFLKIYSVYSSNQYHSLVRTFVW